MAEFNPFALALVDALASSADIGSALGDVLASCLDPSRISKAALYRVDSHGELVLYHAIGSSSSERGSLEADPRYAELFKELCAGRQAVAIPSPAVTPQAAETIRTGLGVASALLVPLTVSRQSVGMLLLGSSLADVSEHVFAFGRTTGAYIAQALALARAFARVNASEQRYRALMEFASDAILVATPAGEILEVNRQAEQLLDRSAADLLGRHYPELIASGWENHVAAERERLLAEGSARFHDVAVARPDGKRVFVDWSAALVETGDDRLVFLIGRDITERKRTEVILRHREAERAELLRREQAARQEAERASRAKDEFISTLSHELRTPLTAILGWASILDARTPDAAAFERGISTILRNAQTQSELLDDIFDAARISTGTLHLASKGMDVVPVVRAAIEAVAPMAEARRLRITAHLDTGPVTMRGDPDRVQQIMLNLLSNAIKFTPRGGLVTVRVERSGPGVRIQVSDTGQGIRAEFLPHVFDRFQQADNSITRVHGGLGLGLAIVRHIVHLHGGWICAESAGEGQGATFTVTFPFLEAPAGDIIAPVPEDAPAEPSRLQGVRVLVVEDEADTRELLSTMLQGAGAQVTAVSSAVEALHALAQSAGQDVLVSDLSMPGPDGYELIRAVRALPEGAGGWTPALALTARATENEVREALLAGYQMHLAKPVEPSALVTIVAALSGRSGP